MDKNILYAIFIKRVSTPNQDVFGDSLDDQEKQCEITRKKASEQYGCDIKILKTFPFAESASVKLDIQPAQKALEYCRLSKLPIRFAFFMNIGRFTRGGAVVYQQLKMEFAKLGITLVDAYGVISPTKINTLEHLGVSYWWSEFNPTNKNELLEAEAGREEITVIETRMIGGAIRAVRAGYWRGQTPLGFMTERVEIIDSDGKQRKRLMLKPFEDEAIWFRKMFERVNEGTKLEEGIVTEVNNMGFVTRPLKYRNKNDRTKIVAIKGSKKLTAKMMRRYIQNPLYAGVNTEKWLQGKPVYLNGGGIVSVDLFNKANKGKVIIVDENGEPKIYRDKAPEWQLKKLKLNPDFPYKQFVLCPICRKPLLASASTGKGRVARPAYHCGNTPARNHKYYRVKLSKFMPVIEKFIKNVKFSDKFIHNFENIFLKNWKLRMEQINKDTINWEKRVIELREKQSMFEDKLKMSSTPTSFQIIETELEKIKGEIAFATIERDKKEDEEVDVQTLINTAKYWMEHFADLVLETTNPLTRATLFGQIFEEFPTFEEIENGTPKISQLYALNEQFAKGDSLQSGIDAIRTRNLFRAKTFLFPKSLDSLIILQSLSGCRVYSLYTFTISVYRFSSGLPV